MKRPGIAVLCPTYRAVGPRDLAEGAEHGMGISGNSGLGAPVPADYASLIRPTSLTASLSIIIEIVPINHPPRIKATVKSVSNTLNIPC